MSGIFEVKTYNVRGRDGHIYNAMNAAPICPNHIFNYLQIDAG
jgi:hypothetical protein